MASDVDIANLALVALGEDPIISLTDANKRARTANTMYALARDALFGGYTWSFAKVRAQLAADVTPPLFQFALAFTIPADCVRIVLVNEQYVGIDLTDYREGPVEDFAIESGKILTNFGAPLNIRYVKRITDPTQFTSTFITAFAAKLAWMMAEPITQSDSKRERAKESFTYEIGQAIMANAIELPPVKLADDEWVISRI